MMMMTMMMQLPFQKSSCSTFQFLPLFVLINLLSAVLQQHSFVLADVGEHTNSLFAIDWNLLN